MWTEWKKKLVLRKKIFNTKNLNRQKYFFKGWINFIKEIEIGKKGMYEVQKKFAKKYLKHSFYFMENGKVIEILKTKC